MERLSGAQHDTMEADSISELLFTKYGKKWHFITPDYAFGHPCSRPRADLSKLGGSMTGNELIPLGTTDFSAYLIKARAANPDVLLVLPQGGDMVNCLKQFVQFGLNKQMHVAGLQQELEIARGDAARGARRHLDVRMVLETTRRPRVEKFVADIRKVNGGKVPTARHWFGYTSVHTLAGVANQEKTLDSLTLAKALGNFELPPEIKLQPNKCYYRAGDHQLMTSAFVGEAQSQGKHDPQDLFRVDQVIPGDKTAPPVERDRLQAAMACLTGVIER